MFELKGRFGLARQKVVKMIRGLEEESASAYSSSGSSAAVRENVVPSANLSVENEIRRAQIIVADRRMQYIPK